MTTAEREELFLSGRGLALALAVIAVLTLILPPVLARRLHQRRVTLAMSQVQAVAHALTSASVAGPRADPQLRNIGVLSGPGDPVTDARDRMWITARTAPLESYVNLPPGGLNADPWAHALQVNIGAAQTGGRVWVLSAGPDGIIETPFVSPGTMVPDGDDIAAPLP